MEHTEITRLAVMTPLSGEVYIPGKDGVKSIYNDDDGFSVIYNDYSVRFFTNTVPLKIDWKVK